MKRLILMMVIVTWASQARAAVPEPKGVWEFDGPDTTAATIGAPLELVGEAQEVAGIDAMDGAIQIGQGSYYVCTHGIAPNGGGSKVNEWTLLIDFSYPQSSRSDPPSGYNDLFQTDPTNTDDADWTINSSGAIGIGAVGYSSAYGYTTNADTWYRLVVVVDNGTRHDIYVDGTEIFQGNEQGVDGRFSLADTILLFCAGYDQDGDDAPINVSTVAMWDTPLTASDILAIGRAGDAFFTQKLATNPTPAAGETDVLTSADLGWTAGAYAATHNVYFSTAEDDLNEALVGDGLARDVTGLDVGLLDYGQTYYWRVDEVNGAPDHSVYQGKVWNFTVEPFAYPIEAITATSNGSSTPDALPENTINGSGLNADDQHSNATADMWLATPGADPLWIEYAFDRVYKLHEMWIWNHNSQFEPVLGFGIKDAAIEYSVDGGEWTTLGDVQLAQATARTDYTANTIVSFEGVPAQYVRLTVNSGYGGLGQYGLSEVRFLHIPAFARLSEPADGATEVAVDAPLAWRAGREAVTHEVYLGTEATAPPLVDTVEVASYTPGTLDFGTTYYWQIDEVNEADAVATWQGDLWSFVTQEFASIDDFESYDDEDNRIYDTWLDGWANSSGSIVGYLEAPFAETSVVNSGRQAMPLEYNNGSSPYYSETERDLGGADWTGGGADALRLFVQGSADNEADTLYVAVEDSAGHVAVVTNDDAAVLTTAAWQEWVVPFADLAGVNLAGVQTLYIGVGDRDNPAAGGSGLVFIDDVGFGHAAD